MHQVPYVSASAADNSGSISKHQPNVKNAETAGTQRGQQERRWMNHHPYIDPNSRKLSWSLNPERDTVCPMTDLIRGISWSVIGEELKWQFRHDNCLSKNTRRFWKRQWGVKNQKSAKGYLRKTDAAFWAEVFFSSKFWMIILWQRYFILYNPISQQTFSIN